MTKWRKIIVTALVAGMCLVALSGFAGASVRNSQGLSIGKTMGGLKSVVVQALGLETEDFVQARQDGKTLRDLLVENNIDVEQFISEQVAARKTVMDQLVADGKMTAEQAVLCLANMEENLDKRLDTMSPCQGVMGGQGCGGQRRGVGQMMRVRMGRGK